MEGFVTKRGHLITNWKVRWFVLDSGEIRYYADKTLQALKGRYILRKESIVSYHADMGLNKNVILIFTTSHPFRKRALYFSCDSPESKTSWFTTISAQLEALRTGIMVPVAAPNILETTIQSVDNLSSRINNTISNTITTVFTTCTPGNEQPHTTDADVEELLKGRPIARNVRNERSMSMDGTDMRSPVQRPVRPLSKRSTLQPGTVKLTAGEGDENGYTAADYDSSDTDGSANEEYPSGRAQRDAREGREKSGSDAPRVRQLSTGQGSAQSAFLAAEALNSPILKKRDAGNNASAASSTTSAAGGKNAAAGVEDAFLPRVSTIVAEEAAQAQQRKLNFNNNHSSKNNANSTSNNSMKAAPSQMSPVGRGQSPVPGGDGKEAARKKPSSFTADTSNSAAFSSTSSTSGNSASSSSAKAKASERAAPTVSAAEGSSSKNTAAAATPAGADPDNPWIEVSSHAAFTVWISRMFLPFVWPGVFSIQTSCRCNVLNFHDFLLQAHTAEGELYYYHKVSRLAR
jgi:hypothetical protein